MSENQPGGFYYNDLVDDDAESDDHDCPCGCGSENNVNCVYDTAKERHLKNVINCFPDEPWVTSALNAAQPA